jgi:short-subunit dehydrogenase
MDLGGFVETTPARLATDGRYRSDDAVYGSKAFGQQMIDAGVHGHIVNVASAAAFLPSETRHSLWRRKSGSSDGDTQSLRVELAPHHIGVTAICRAPSAPTDLLQHGSVTD